MDYQVTRQLLEQYHLYPKQSLGQNFLVDERAAYSIASACMDSKPEVVLEIGPGLGSLTEQLLKFTARVVAVEIDRMMIEVLEDRFATEIAAGRLELIHADVRDLNLAEHLSDEAKISVAANIPYYCTADIFQQLLCQLPHAQQIVLLVQQEAGDRLLANPGLKLYGTSSVLTHLFGVARVCYKVPANCFYPRPKVTSSVLVLTARDQHKLLKTLPEQRASMEQRYLLDQGFLAFLKLSFAMRRKKLLNNLQKKYSISAIKTVLRDLQLSEVVRSEQVEPDKFYRLYQELEKTI